MAEIAVFSRLALNCSSEQSWVMMGVTMLKASCVENNACEMCNARRLKFDRFKNYADSHRIYLESFECSWKLLFMFTVVLRDALSFILQSIVSLRAKHCCVLWAWHGPLWQHVCYTKLNEIKACCFRNNGLRIDFDCFTNVLLCFRKWFDFFTIVHQWTILFCFQ